LTATTQPVLADFWAAVAERPVSGTGEFFAFIDRTETDPAVIFIKVPEDKTANNRLHLDLDCDDLAGARDRLLGWMLPSCTRRTRTACTG
jgi:Glyoxalase-like domain